MTNKYAGKCHACGKQVAAGSGELEKQGYLRREKWVVWCKACYNKSNNSGADDSQCGDRAYEDQCAAQCGF
jgi:hypothetical protein